MKVGSPAARWDMLLDMIIIYVGTPSEVPRAGHGGPDTENFGANGLGVAPKEHCP